jgi:ribosomal protein S18 acetylase RimI-like enzyme
MRMSTKGAVIELAPLGADVFEKWKPVSIADYARQHVIGGRWTAEEALRLSREEFDRLLPRGLATPGHRFFSIVRSSDRKAVGLLWIQVEGAPKQSAFIFNIEIFRAFRRRGFGRQAMKLLEEEARRLDLESIRLHVFGHNTAARSLYEQLGYVATNVQMKKRLAKRPSRAARTAPPGRRGRK